MNDFNRRILNRGPFINIVMNPRETGLLDEEHEFTISHSAFNGRKINLIYK